MQACACGPPRACEVRAQVAKLATGEMAFDDVWWGGMVKNPWNIAQGSSGSSGGPAAAVAAGALPFALGTETEGSLLAPAERCGATAMRPTFGAVGRSGVMSLVDSLARPARWRPCSVCCVCGRAWCAPCAACASMTSLQKPRSCLSHFTNYLGCAACSWALTSLCASIEDLHACAQDKVGPFCRAAADCAAIYDVIRGRDAADPGSRDAALPDPATLNISGLVVGMLPSAQPYAAEVRPAAIQCACLS